MVKDLGIHLMLLIQQNEEITLKVQPLPNRQKVVHLMPNKPVR